MNLYEKLQIIKQELLESNLKKTGKNKYAGFEYFELADFLPTIVKLCNEHKVFTSISFNHEFATLTAINSEKPDELIKTTSPMRELELKGCNQVQALGGVQTYQRRYLYMALFDITESDMFDCQKENEEIKKAPEQKYYCETCKNEIQEYRSGKTVLTPKQVYELAKNKYNKGLCTECANKLKEEKKQEGKTNE